LRDNLQKERKSVNETQNPDAKIENEFIDQIALLE